MPEDGEPGGDEDCRCEGEAGCAEVAEDFV
jgi:hypothetical protein